MNVPAMVAALANQLGFKLVAYIGGVQETRIVRYWARGVGEPANTQDVERLRLAFRAASLIMARESAAVAQAWFRGLNPTLGDVSPARLLREGDIDVVGPQVLAAARQFAALG
ncbi:hypothetical protein [Mycobacteroides abscessus]|uniref:hypothetical protein n=1 Tax=Mycobacteroides abscessus TaxID=36809 RepID=UPI00177BB206|nr:hypothetical protein [Mycobacteroides abscessus]QOF44121.1 hypothetical protein E3G69_003170 [Mycobacteroides abscessus]QOF48820.1 hypothetical protein E3G70_003169 [Mycobacteroides abscessus]